MFAAVTIVAAPLFAALFGQPRLTGLVRALSVIFVFAALDSVPTALLQRELNWRTQALRRLGATAASAAVAISLAVMGAGAWALVGQQLTLEGLTVVLLWALVQWRPRLRFSGPAFKALIGFGSRYSVLRILWYLGSNIDNFLIGVFLGPVALGFYVLAYRVFTVLNELLVTTINNVAMSMFARMQTSPSALRASLVRTSTLTLVFSLPVYAGLALLAGQLVPVLFGPHWGRSVPVLEFLTVAGCLQAQLAVTSSYVIGTGRVKREVPWTAGVTAAQLAAFAVAVQFGIVAVAAALAAVFLIAWPVRLALLRAWDGLSLVEYFKNLIPIAVASALMAAIVAVVRVLLAHEPLAVALPAEILAGALVYPLALSALMPSKARAVRARIGVVLRGDGLGADAHAPGSAMSMPRRPTDTEPTDEAIDVLVVAANTTFGLRRDYEEIVDGLRETGLSVGVVSSNYDGLLGPLRRLSLATDELIVAVSLRRAVVKALRLVTPRVVLITTSSAGGLLPRQVLQGAAVRFDALAANIRPRRREALTRAFERRCLNGAVLALPTSQRAGAELLECGGAPPQVVWPPPLRPAPAVAEERLRAGLCYANNPEKKGLDLVVQAWAVAAPTLPLFVTGITESAGERFLRSRRVPLPSDIRWLGTVPENEHRALSGSVLVYVSASRVEQFGIAQLEALLDGALLAAVPSRGPSDAVELARQLDPRLVADSIDARALAKSIDAALQLTPEAQARYRTRARELLAAYSRETFLETLRQQIIPALLRTLAGEPLALG